MARGKRKLNFVKQGQQHFVLQSFPDFIKETKGKELGKIAEALSSDFLSNTTSARQEIDNALVGEIDNITDYLHELNKMSIKFNRFWGLYYRVFPPSGTMPQIRKQLAKLTKHVGSWAQPGGKGTKTFNVDHKEINIAVLTLTMIYTYLAELKEEMLEGRKVNKLTDKRLKRVDNIVAEYGTEKNPKTAVISPAQFEDLLSSIQYNIAAGAALQKLLQGKKFSGSTISAITTEFLEEENFDLTTTKENIFNIASGKAVTKVQVTSGTWNRLKGVYEKYLKRSPFKQFLAPSMDTSGKVVKDMQATFEPGKAHSIKNIVGSKSMQQELTQQAIDTLAGKKPKTYKKKGKGKATKRTKAKARTTNALADAAVATVLLKKNLKESERLVSSTKAKKRDNSEKDMALSQRELNKIITRINRRLPAEVRRNMGRPALINRTGRFSNSARLLTLKASRGGLAGKFSYMLNPYETFENTGEKRWRVGYNPKPLISKSTRKLAQEIIGRKITITLRRG